MSDQNHNHNSKYSNNLTVKLIWRFLADDEPLLRALLIYSISLGLLSLVIPIAVQTLVNHVTYGTLIQPIIILSILLLGFLSFTGAVRIIQYISVEWIQRRLFARVAVAKNNIGEQDPSTIKFLEIATIQKSGASLLIDGLTIVLQAATGVIVLSLYHPWFFLFSIIVILLMSYIVLSEKTAIQTAMIESDKKYALLDSLSGTEDSKSVPTAVSIYLKARSHHFNILLRKFVFSIGLQAIASTALLGIGGILVIQGQLTVGQLIAAELIASVVLLNFSKVPKYLENFYDVVASFKKIEKFLHLEPLDIHSDPDIISTPSQFSTPKYIFDYSRKLGIATIGFIIFSIFLPWQQTSQGDGKVIAYSPTERPQNIEAPFEGKVTELLVNEGSKVNAGDNLFQVVDNDPEILSRLRKEKEAVEIRLAAAEKAIETSKKNVVRQKQLEEKGLSSSRSFELAELEYARYLTDAANASAELARIETRLSRQSQQIVKAPRAGIIHRVLKGRGQEMVKATDPIMVLVPDAEYRSVELLINGNDIPLLTEGQKVRIQFEGWPALQFAGWPSVAVGTFGGIVSVVDPSDNGSGLFRILVNEDPKDTPWPKFPYLRQGARATGWVLLNQVTIGFEIWRRLNGFPVSLKQKPENAIKVEGKK